MAMKLFVSGMDLDKRKWNGCYAAFDNWTERDYGIGLQLLLMMMMLDRYPTKYQPQMMAGGVGVAAFFN